MRTETLNRRLRWFIGLFLLIQGACAWSASLAEVPFKLHAGLIWVEVQSLGGGKSLNFILDSGAEASVLDLNTVRRLRLKLGESITIRGVNATTEGFWPEHMPARMGETSLPSNYLAMDLSAVSSACHRKVDGLIGADFLAGRVTQIDFAKGKIRLLENYMPESNAEVLPLQVEAARLRVPVEVMGLGKGAARLDTGCASALHWAVSPNLPAEEGSSQEVAVGVSSILIRQHSQSVELGRLTIKGVAVGLHTESLLAGETGLLGAGLLSQFSTVTIDEPGRQLILEGYRSSVLSSKPSGPRR